MAYRCAFASSPAVKGLSRRCSIARRPSLLPRSRNVVRATSSSPSEVDFPAIGGYVASTALQWGAFTLALFSLDRLVLPRLPHDAQLVFVAATFLAASFGSRVLSPLDASRPTIASEKAAMAARARPSWMPPPFVFPVVWTTLGGLRAAAATVVFASTNTLLCAPLLSFALHLCCGDTWNYINNKQQRLGVAVTGVLFVLGSAIATAALYYRVSPLAGQLLTPLCVWLGVATALVFDIWRINGGADLFPLLPTKHTA